MLTYSKQLISELVTMLPSRLINFYDKTKDSKSYPANDIQELVEYCLNTIYKGSLEKDELMLLNRELDKKTRNKKDVWLKAFEKSLEYNIEEKKNALNFLDQEYKLLDNDKWNTLYNGRTFDEIVAEETKKIRVWSKDNTQYLIDYPLINTKQDRYIIAAYALDLANAIMNITKNSYGGDFTSFFKSFPDNFIEVPLFSPTSYLLDIKQNQSKGLFEEFIFNESSLLRAEIKDNSSLSTEKKSFRSLDAFDQKLFSYVFNYILEKEIMEPTVSISFNIIVRAMFPDIDKLSKNHYQRVLDRCLKLAQFTYKKYDKSSLEGYAYNIFDNVIVEGQDEKKMLHISFGSVPYNAIVNEKVIRVTSKNYDALENKLSKLLYYALQKERLLLFYSMDNQVRLVKNYRIGTFKRWVRFRATNARIVEMVKESLDEFVARQIAIESYVLENNVFEITYFPLTEDEKKDFKDFRNFLDKDYSVPVVEAIAEG